VKKKRTDKEIDNFLAKLGEAWKEKRSTPFGWLCMSIMAEDCDYHEFYDGSDEAFLERIAEFNESGEVDPAWPPVQKVT